jgi:hypothetical protein
MYDSFDDPIFDSINDFCYIVNSKYQFIGLFNPGVPDSFVYYKMKATLMIDIKNLIKEYNTFDEVQQSMINSYTKRSFNQLVRVFLDQFMKFESYLK